MKVKGHCDSVVGSPRETAFKRIKLNAVSNLPKSINLWSLTQENFAFHRASPAGAFRGFQAVGGLATPAGQQGIR